MAVIDLGDFRTAMRQVASSVTIIAGELDGMRRGLTATAVCSLSFDPPSLLVCIGRSAAAHDIIVQSRRFSVNVLSTGQQDLARIFSGEGQVSGDDRFRHGRWRSLVTGAPILMGSVVNFDCELSQAVEASTHTVLLAATVGVLVDESKPPLLYANRQYTALGEPGRLHAC